MGKEHELTVRIEETETGSYRARLAAAPERHFAESEDLLVAARGALAVARRTVEAAVGDDRRADRERVASE
jgi:hypothetical protein